jgi:hypothetical protein
LLTISFAVIITRNYIVKQVMAKKVNEGGVDDPESFIQRMPQRMAKMGHACSVICPKCGKKHTVLKNWPDGLEKQGWGTTCGCGQRLPLSSYFAESAVGGSPGHSAQKVANNLLETEEDDLSRLLDYGIPGVEVKAESPVKRTVYLRGQVVGWVYYGHETPPESMPLEWRNYYKEHPWTAIPISPRRTGKDCDSLSNAVRWLVLKDYVEAERAKRQQESIDPDDIDPEEYAMTTEPGVGSLHDELKKMYDHVGVHVDEPKVSLRKGERRWVVTCRRSTPLPIKSFGLDANKWRNQIVHYLNQWGNQNEMFVDQVEIHGFFRKNVTFTFVTTPYTYSEEVWQQRFGKKPQQEALDPDDPESYLRATLPKFKWEQSLLQTLREFHPTGVLYSATGTDRAAVVSATTYFDPEKDDWRMRFYEVVKTFLHKVMFHGSTYRLYCHKKHNTRPGYDEWYALITINLDVPQHTPMVEEIL